MKYHKFNKYEKREIKSQIVKEALAGNGLYLYQNSNAHAELTLPRPTKSGKRVIAPNGSFQGDDYYMQLVRTGMLRLVEVLQTPEQEKTVQQEENNMNESTEKLILDQPETVTTNGPVEHVVSNSETHEQPLHESTPQPKQPVLLNEAPMDDGFIIVEEN